jgi:surfactin synthase thioesterase subunit
LRRLSTVSFVIFKGELTEVRSHVNGEKKKLEEGLKQQLKELLAPLVAADFQVWAEYRLEPEAH